MNQINNNIITNNNNNNNNDNDSNINEEFLLLAFNTSHWKPNQSEWDNCIIKLNDEIERKRIMNYKRPNSDNNGKEWLIGKDNDTAKSSMVGRLLIIELAKTMLSITNENDIKFKRTDSNKPYLVINDSNNNFKNYNFNVSHDSDWVVAMGSLNLTIGIDIMNSKLPRKQTMKDFFNSMSTCFSDKEWKVINSGHNEKAKVDLFFIHWCLKESYIKADGKGLEIELKSLEFELNQNNQTAQLYINKKRSENYQFTYFQSFLNNNNKNNKDDDNDILAICIDTSKLNHDTNSNNNNNIITKDNLKVKILTQILK